MSTQPFNSDGGFTTLGNITAGNIILATGNSVVFDSATGNAYISQSMGLTVAGEIGINLTVNDGAGDFNTVGIDANANIQTPGSITATSISASGNVTGGNVLAGGLYTTAISATGIVYVDSTGKLNGDAAGLSTDGNGNLSAYGNVTAGGFVTTGGTGNITGANVISAQTYTSPGNVTISSSNTTILFDSYDNMYFSFAGNSLGQIGFDATNDFYISPNGNTFIQSALGVNGNISTTGNIIGGYLYGDGSNISGIASPYGNANVATFLANFGANNFSSTGNITANNVSAGTYTNSNANVLITTTVSGDTSTITFDQYNDIYFAWNGNSVGSIGFDATSDFYISPSGNTIIQSLLSVTGSINTSANVTGGNLISGRVVGTGNLHLQPDPSNSSAYLDIYLTTGPDVHIAGNGENVIIGGDSTANVTVNTVGNVTIQSWNGSAHTWNFGNDGSMTAPGSVTATAFDVGSSTVYEDTSLILQGGASISITSPNNTTVTAASENFVFDTGGNLTVPTTLNASSVFTAGSGGDIAMTGGNITGANNIVMSGLVSNSTGNINITGNLIPTGNAYFLGSISAPWANAYFGSQSITILDTVTGNTANSVTIENNSGNISMGTAGFTIGALGNGTPVFTIEALTGQIYSNAETIIQNTTNSANNTSGSLQTAGGAGIAQDLYVGGNITVGAGGNFTQSITVDGTMHAVFDNLYETGGDITADKNVYVGRLNISDQPGDLPIPGITTANAAVDFSLGLPNDTGNVYVARTIVRNGNRGVTDIVPGNSTDPTIPANTPTLIYTVSDSTIIALELRVNFQYGTTGDTDTELASLYVTKNQGGTANVAVGTVSSTSGSQPLATYSANVNGSGLLQVYATTADTASTAYYRYRAVEFGGFFGV